MEFAEIPMSTALAATLTRASEAATAFGYPEITLEHLLLALCDDGDALAVLDASHVAVGRLKSEVIGYLTQSPPFPQSPSGLGVATDTARILEAASAAARGGRRSDINGAIVLAAIVGDGRSVAAQMLQAQGLTFAEAIRSLQRALTAPAAPIWRDAPISVPPAEDVLARARERVQSRATPSLRELLNEPPRVGLPPPPPPPAMPRPPTAMPQPVAMPPLSEFPKLDDTPDPVTAGPLAADTAVDVTAPYALPGSADLEVEFAPSEANINSGPVVADGLEPAIVAAPPVDDASARHGPPSWASAMRSSPLSFPKVETSVQAQRETADTSKLQSAPVSTPPLSVPPAFEEPVQAEPASELPLPAPDFYPADTGSASVAEPQIELAPPAPMKPPPIPQNAPQVRTEPTFAPRPPGTFAEGGRLPPLEAPPFSAEPAFARHSERDAFPSFDLPSPMPYPPAPTVPGLSLPSLPQSSSSQSTSPVFTPIRSDTAFNPAPPAQTLSAPERTRIVERGATPVDISEGQLTENIPRTMRVAKPERVEIRLSKLGLLDVTTGLDGGGLAFQHTVTVAKAMSVRMRAPDGGFFIETASPETQWIESAPEIGGEDFASWRFVITPQSKGHARLQIVVSARTVGADGIAAETVLPDQVIDVRVATNYQKSAARWIGWIAAAIAGGVLARFGEAGLDAAMPVVSRFLS